MNGSDWGVSWQELIVAASGAALLSLFYFGGLWLTVRQLVLSDREPAAFPWRRQPALIAMFSFLVRTGLVVVGLYVVTGGRMLPLLVAMGVFVAMRMVVTRRMVWR